MMSKGGSIGVTNIFREVNVGDGQKLQLASMHMYEKALACHLQFVGSRGPNVPWNEYENEVLKRFGVVYEDPLAGLKNLKQDGKI